MPRESGVSQLPTARTALEGEAAHLVDVGERARGGRKMWWSLEARAEQEKGAGRRIARSDSGRGARPRGTTWGARGPPLLCSAESCKRESSSGGERGSGRGERSLARARPRRGALSV